MKVHILDDWFDTLKMLSSYSLLANHEVTIWNDHVEDVQQLADRLAEAEVLVLFRNSRQNPVVYPSLDLLHRSIRNVVWVWYRDVFRLSSGLWVVLGLDPAPVAAVPVAVASAVSGGKKVRFRLIDGAPSVAVM